MALYSLTIDNLALAAATAKTAVELSAPTSKGDVVRWWVSFDGVTASAIPVKVEVGRFSAAVTTASTLAGYEIDPEDAAPTVVAKHSTTVEGAGTFLGGEIHRVSPYGGRIDVQYPGSDLHAIGREGLIPVGGFWRIRLTAPAIVNATFGVVWEE